MTVHTHSSVLARWTTPSGFFRLLIAAAIGFACYLLYRSAAATPESSYLVPHWSWDVPAASSTKPNVELSSPPSPELSSPLSPEPQPTVFIKVPAKVPAKPINPLPKYNPYIDDVWERIAHNYTQNLIVPALKEEDTSWIQDDLEDLVGPGKAMNLLKYIVDDDTAALRPAINKGHEAMVYLTYMLDFYDDLPDVSIFIHAHRDTWHNVGLLDQSTPNMLRRLNPEKVFREGYFNLRCEWEPGCPSRIQVTIEKEDDTKEEQPYFAKAFPEIFPNDATPDVLAQPCCAQFALSRDQIRSVSRETYTHVRDWLTNTDLDDSTSGRMLEYTWQYLFLRTPIFCPDQHLCLCDGYSVCFPDWKAYQTFEHLCHVGDALNDELNRWRDMEDEYHSSMELNLPEGEGTGPPDEERMRFLENQLTGIASEIERRKVDAFRNGNDPEKRMRILSDAWEELDRHPKGNG